MNSARPTFAGPRARFKAWLRTTFAAVMSIIGAAALWRLMFADRGVRILTYHGVESPPTGTFAVDVKDFEKQIAYVADRYDVLDFPTFLKWRQNDYRSEKPKVIVTFDDGLENNVEFAAPILKKYGVPATFFIIGSRLDASVNRYMSEQDALSLLESDLFDIGSHTQTHASVARIDDDKRKKEIGGSKTFLEERLGREIIFFCYPYGTFKDFNDRSVELLEQCGYELGCTSVNGVNFKDTNLYKLRRTKVEWSDDMKTFTRLMNGALDGWIVIDFFFRFLQRPSSTRAR